MNLVQWNPLRDFDDFFDRYGTTGRTFWRGGEPGHDWMPLVDVRETDEGYRLDLEIPAVDPKDVSVRLDERVLSISGERPFDAVDEGQRLRHRERRYGRFTRSFRLPEDADGDNVVADARNGVLSIMVGKRLQPEGKAIEVQFAS